jgi:alkaline phosphatase
MTKATLLCLAAVAALSAQSNTGANTSAIFFNVDGASSAHWMGARWLKVGPDGMLNWDKLPHMADYRHHTYNMLSVNSVTGSTIQAYGVKVKYSSYGTDDGKPIISPAGKNRSILEEAKAAGKAVGLVNTSEISEAGTGAFLAKLTKPGEDNNEVSRQMIEAQPDLILGGGEVYLLPEGVKGRHGAMGRRKDGVNLIERAKALGYTVVFTRDELVKAPLTSAKVLGIFAAGQLLNRDTESGLLLKNLPAFVPGSPTIAEMADFAVKFLSRKPNGFFLALNDEAPDDFSNENNARDALNSLVLSDDAVGVLSDYVAKNPQTLLLVTADAPSAGFVLLGRLLPPLEFDLEKPLPPINATHGTNGAPMDGRDGANTPPFLAAPNREGVRLPFAVAWGSKIDNAGSVLARAIGRKAERVQGNLDNTDVYRVLYEALFDKRLN